MDEIRETAPSYRVGKYTYEDYAKLPEWAPYQLVGGDLVFTPARTPYHQEVLLNLGHPMYDFVLANDLGVFFLILDVYLDDKETYQPDIVFIAGGRTNIVGEKNIEGAPDLVVEILSPITAYYDLKPKFRNYEKYGVREYWIVDPEGRSVEIFVLKDARFLPSQRIRGSGVVESKILAGFTVTLEQIFRRHEPPAASDAGLPNSQCTFDDLARLPEGAPYQLIGGDLVLGPYPYALDHQLVLASLYKGMRRFTLENDLDLAVLRLVGVYLNEEESYRPDLILIAEDRVAAKTGIKGAPDLVVEILSAITAYYDLKPKFRNYEKYGVREYWIVDPEDQSVEIFVLEGGSFLPARRVVGSATVDSKVLTGFTVTLDEIFFLT